MIARAAAAVFAALLIAGLGLDARAAEAVPRVRLDVVVAAGGAPLEGPVRVEVRRRAGGEPVAAAEAVPVELALPAGAYTARIAYRETVAVRDFTVAGRPGERHVLDLRAGLVTLAAVPHPGAPPLEAPVRWRVATYGRDSAGRRLAVAAATGARPELLLARGHYVVEAELGANRVRHTIEVEAGRHLRYTLDLTAGRLR